MQDAIDFVTNDVDNDNQDTVDIQKKVTIAKKRKLCSSGHINDNVKSNRTVCDRQHCKSKLQFGNPIAMKPSYKETNNDDVEKEILRAKHYMNVPNISNGEKPKEMAVGALAVNPNTPDRIARCLDEVIDAADMKNKFSVKIVLNANSV